MFGLPVNPQPQRGKRRNQKKYRFRRSLALMVPAAVGLWLMAATVLSDGAMFGRVLGFCTGALILLHIAFYHISEVRILKRARNWPRPFAICAAAIALLASPMFLYPLGILAVVVAIWQGVGVGLPLAIAGVVILSPIIVIIILGLIFALSRG